MTTSAVRLRLIVLSLLLLLVASATDRPAAQSALKPFRILISNDDGVHAPGILCGGAGAAVGRGSHDCRAGHQPERERTLDHHRGSDLRRFRDAPRRSAGDVSRRHAGNLRQGRARGVAEVQTRSRGVGDQPWLESRRRRVCVRDRRRRARGGAFRPAGDRRVAIGRTKPTTARPRRSCVKSWR